MFAIFSISVLKYHDTVKYFPLYFQHRPPICFVYLKKDSICQPSINFAISNYLTVYIFVFLKNSIHEPVF